MLAVQPSGCSGVGQEGVTIDYSCMNDDWNEMMNRTNANTSSITRVIILVELFLCIN